MSAGEDGARPGVESGAGERSDSGEEVVSSEGETSGTGFISAGPAVDGCMVSAGGFAVGAAETGAETKDLTGVRPVICVDLAKATGMTLAGKVSTSEYKEYGKDQDDDTGEESPAPEKTKRPSYDDYDDNHFFAPSGTVSSSTAKPSQTPVPSAAGLTANKTGKDDDDAVVIKTGKTVTVSGTSYKVVSSGSKSNTVEYASAKKNAATVKIPATVKLSDSKTYQVVSISKKAFAGNTKLKKAVIGKNVQKIAAGAFSGCKNLKQIIIQSKELKSVGKDAFKGIHKKCVIKVPKEKLKEYKKLLKKKGQPSGVKIIA